MFLNKGVPGGLLCHHPRVRQEITEINLGYQIHQGGKGLAKGLVKLGLIQALINFCRISNNFFEILIFVVLNIIQI